MADVACESTCFPVAPSDQAGALTCDHTHGHPWGPGEGPALQEAAGTRQARAFSWGSEAHRWWGNSRPETSQGVSPEAQA